MDQVSVEATGLTKRYTGASVAYEAINLSIAQKEFCVFVGKSGCGKTSLLRSFAGLNPPTAGTLSICGTPIYGKPGAVVQRPPGRVGFVFQEPNLLPWRTVAENIRLPLEAIGASRSTGERIDMLAAQVGLQRFLDSYPAELSGGMRQRVSLARALACEPGLLLMDEPFGALDAITREQMNDLLERVWLSTSATVVLVTHSISEALVLADRVVVMTPNPGRVRSIHTIETERPRGKAWLNSAQARAMAQEITEHLEG